MTGHGWLVDVRVRQMMEEEEDEETVELYSWTCRDVQTDRQAE